MNEQELFEFARDCYRVFNYIRGRGLLTKDGSFVTPPFIAEVEEADRRIDNIIQRWEKSRTLKREEPTDE